VGQMQRSSMRRFGLKLLQSAAGSVATITLTAHAFAAPNVTVSVGGQSYTVTYTDPFTSYNTSTAVNPIATLVGKFLNSSIICYSGRKLIGTTLR
jgi:hypothetical protein